MFSAVNLIIDQLGSCLTQEAFTVIFSQTLDKTEEYDLDELRIPRIRGPPSRYSCGKIPDIPSSPENIIKVSIINLLRM